MNTRFKRFKTLARRGRTTRLDYLAAACMAVTLALASCSDDTGTDKDKPIVDPPLQAGSRPIDFNSAPVASTKAPVIDGNNITNFKVSANLPQSSLPGQQTLKSETGFNFFERINVLRRDSLGHWGYSPSVYWPARNDAVS
ncbi:MAG: hypothetical protein LBL81_00115, partial [Tannerella sp.]|nr:hypothetical protein [Tannerella sp.]